jgi:hypothetical protein
MKITYTSRDGRLVAEFEATTQKQIFALVAEIQEVFEEEKCGKCGSERIRCSVTEHDGHKYYKLRCECGAQIDFGQHKVGDTLFIKRRDENKEPLPNHGWYVWGDEGQQRPEDQPQQGYASKPADKAPKHQDVRPGEKPVGVPLTVGDAAEKAQHAKFLKDADTLLAGPVHMNGLENVWRINFGAPEKWRTFTPRQQLALIEIRDKHKARLGWKGAEVPA